MIAERGAQLAVYQKELERKEAGLLSLGSAQSGAQFEIEALSEGKLLSAGTKSKSELASGLVSTAAVLKVRLVEGANANTTQGGKRQQQSGDMNTVIHMQTHQANSFTNEHQNTRILEHLSNLEHLSKIKVCLILSLSHTIRNFSNFHYASVRVLPIQIHVPYQSRH